MRPVDLQTAIANTNLAERAQQGTHPHQTEQSRQAVAKHLQDEYEHRLDEVQRPEDPETEMVREKTDKDESRKQSAKRQKPEPDDDKEEDGDSPTPTEHIDLTA